MIEMNQRSTGKSAKSEQSNGMIHARGDFQSEEAMTDGGLCGVGNNVGRR